MKTWIGLALALVGIGVGLASTVLTNLATSDPKRANILGLDTTSIMDSSPTLVGSSLLILIISFCLIFSSKRTINRR
ncbi:MAG: hypothetical protein ACFB15_19075 [Cyclobacteriaceae bacterium]